MDIFDEAVVAAYIRRIHAETSPDTLRERYRTSNLKSVSEEAIRQIEAARAERIKELEKK
jgi:hypothetical protein